MNCGLGGQLLTTSELEAIALANGATAEHLERLQAAHHNAIRHHSDLLDLTDKAREAMWQRGELCLDTSEAVLGRWRDSLR